MIHEKEALAAFTTMVSFAPQRTSLTGGILVRFRHLKFSCFAQFGEDHSQTRYSKEFLCTITKQAVKVERSLRQAGADCTEQTVEVLVVTAPWPSLYLLRRVLMPMFSLSPVPISHK